MKEITAFQTSLMSWFRQNKRDLPWRKTADPYMIWLSEIILQQTRIDQGTPYFNRFVNRFPTVERLAAASLDDVLRTWEGLGYYSRARNLHKGARLVVEKWNGTLPGSYADLLTIPGIGSYTAAAIASIAFGLPHAVLDGNVVRVLSRLYAEPDVVTEGPVKKRLQERASTLLNVRAPGDHNEAMMELGAMICTPRNPSCDICPVRDQCKAFLVFQPTDFPKKRQAKKIPHYDIAVGVVRDAQGRIYLQKRSESGMLGGLWEFPGGKNEPPETLEATCRREIKEETGLDVTVGSRIASIAHAYSHFKITLHAYACSLERDVRPVGDHLWEWAVHENLPDYAFPRANRKLIDLLSAPPHGTRSPEKD